MIEAPPIHPFKPPPKRRATGYNEETAEQICERVGNGEQLHDICKDPQMPGASTVYRWRAEHPIFDKMYECALLARFELRCETELLPAARASDNDYELVPGKSEADVPTVKPNKESLGRSQLIVDTLKWMMAKELPFKYGEPKPQAVPAPAAQEAAAPVQPSQPSANVVSLLDQVGMRATK